jgi:hypothetical protein
LNFFTQGRKPQIEPRQTNEKTSTLLSCGCQGPHKKFLGIDHYFKMTGRKPSSNIQSKPFIPNRRNTSSNEEDTDDNTENGEESDKDIDDDDDDDKDVVYEQTSPDTYDNNPLYIKQFSININRVSIE